MTEKELDTLYDAFIKVAKAQVEVFKEFVDRLDHAKVRKHVIDELKKTFDKEVKDD